jgi:tetratricopeptide (TPR) repeat protein
MRYFTPIIFLFILAWQNMASAQAGQDFVYNDRYRECAAMAAHEPNAALKMAKKTLDEKQDIGMRHCKAMALYALKQYPKAVTELERVERLIAPENITLKNYVIRQIARALNLSKKPDAALKRLQTHIISLQAGSLRAGENNSTLRTRLASEALLERAMLRESYHQYVQAIQDLDHAVSLDAGNHELLYHRARVLLALHDKALARQDLTAILRENPNHKQARALLKKAK